MIGIAPLRRSVAPTAIGVTSSVISVRLTLLIPCRQVQLSLSMLGTGKGLTRSLHGQIIAPDDSTTGGPVPGNSGRRLLRKLLEGAASTHSSRRGCC